MRVKVEVLIDVDPAAWAANSGIDRSEVREDLKRYIKAHLDGAALLDEAEAELTVR